MWSRQDRVAASGWSSSDGNSATFVAVKMRHGAPYARPVVFPLSRVEKPRIQLSRRSVMKSNLALVFTVGTLMGAGILAAQSSDSSTDQRTGSVQSDSSTRGAGPSVGSNSQDTSNKRKHRSRKSSTTGANGSTNNSGSAKAGGSTEANGSGGSNQSTPGPNGDSGGVAPH
jgi:hypothetical protein